MTRHHQPPAFPAWLLDRLTAGGDADLVRGDFLEEFDARAASNGAAAARRWFYREVLRSALPLLRQRWRARRAGTVRPSTAEQESWPEQLGADARFAFRLSRRGPVGSIAIVITMALGTAATTAVFSVTDAVLLEPLPFAGSSQVVQLEATLRDGRAVDGMASPDVADFRRLVPSATDIALFQRNDLTAQFTDGPVMLRALQVDPAYSRVFSLHAAAGRLIAAGDTTQSAPAVAVLSYSFWQRQFGGQQSVIGRTLTVNGEPVQIVGVLAANSFLFSRQDADVLTPLVLVPNSIMTNRGALWASAAARIRPGVPLALAAQEVGAAAKLLQRDHPKENDGIGAVARPIRDAVVGSAQSMLELLAFAMAAVLLMACTNVANLILGRAQLRAREFAVRSAIGGSPARVRRQVYTEGVVLAAIGGILGIALVPLLTRSLVAIYPEALPRANEIHLDIKVFAVGLATTAIAGLLAAWPTARRAVRLDLSAVLRGTKASASGDDRRSARMLVVTQVAASLALVFTAGLLLDTFVRLTRADPGFEPDHTLSFRVFAAAARRPATRDFDAYYDNVERAIANLAGVRSVSTTTLLPFGGSRSYDVFVQEERGDLGPLNPAAAMAVVTPGIDRALGFRVLRGRMFGADDDSAHTRVLVINQAIANRNYPGIDPVGRFIKWNGQEHWRIVGVVANTRLDSLWGDPMPVLYAPEAQVPRRGRYVVVRSSASPAATLASVRTVMRSLDPTVPLMDVSMMDERLSRSLAPQRFRALLVCTLGLLALVLALIGIYGVVANAVSRRVREIGIRMALGESTRGVRFRVVFDAFRGAGPGIALGLLACVVGSRWLASFLVGVSPLDVPMLTGATIVLVGVVFGAAYGPARRASRVDPASALRGE